MDRQEGRGAVRRSLLGARGLAPHRGRLRRGAPREGPRRHAGRRGRRARRQAPRAPRRRGVRRAARPLGRGRLRAGAARVRGDPVHGLGRHGVGDGDGQDRLEGDLQGARPRRHPVPRLPARPRRGDPRRGPAVRRALRREARRRGLLGGRADREGPGEARRRLPGGGALQGRRHRGALREGHRGERRGARREGARRDRDRPRERVLRLRRQVHGGDDEVLLPGADPGGARAARDGRRGGGAPRPRLQRRHPRRLHRRRPTARRSSSR